MGVLRSTFFTFSVKVLTAVLNFGIALLTARYLGAGGRGVVSLFVLNVSMVFMVSSLVGGPGLVYLAPRHEAAGLMSASMAWAVVCSVAVPVVIWLSGLCETGFLAHLMVLSYLHFIVRIHQHWLLARERFTAYNLSMAVFPVLMAACLLLSFVVYGRRSVDAFIDAYYVAISLNLVTGLVFVARAGGLRFTFRMKKAFSESFRLGYVIQGGNLMQLLNYRLSYYLLQTFFTRAFVGVFSMATAFSESTWLIANSFATVQYTRIANSGDDAANARLTVAVLRLSFWLTVAALAVLLVLPPAFFSFFLSDEFKGLTAILPWLAPGMLCVVISIAISHYFSGSGNPKAGFLGSTAGFAVTLAAGFLLVPAYGLTGAALTATLSYAVSAGTLLYLFMRRHPFRVRDLLPMKKDWRLLKELGG